MAASLWRPVLLELSVGKRAPLSRQGWFVTWIILALSFALTVLPNSQSLAQVVPEVRDRVIPAAVQIVVIADATSDGVTEPTVVLTGSGTIVSSTGHILTNWHVVEMATHRQVLDDWEAQAAREG